MNTDTKSIFTSKTLIVNAIIALAATYPPAAKWVSENPSITLYGLAAINAFLRFITKSRVVLFND